MLDICFCEPFIISGILPTLGVATLKSALDEKNISSKIFYPSIDFFMETKILLNNNFSKLLDDIPLQITEILFCDDISSCLKTHKKTFDNDLEDYVLKLSSIANKVLNSFSKEISNEKPKVFCYSYTFGGYNFTKRLFSLIKQEQPDIKIVVGGSNCVPDFSQSILNEFPEVDYVVCDESAESFVSVVENILFKTSNDISHVSVREKIATSYKFLTDIDNQQCPNFDDYFTAIAKYNIAKEYITLPYEISRGCWWCEQKPCRMCGFFGNRKHYIHKSPLKVIKELHYLSERYDVYKFRFSDLVQPPKDYLEQIQPLAAYNMNFFYEIRPDVIEKDISLLRNIGVTFAQIGIESLNTKQLQYMNKGTTGIHNIYILLLCAAYKIDVIWNYLYGFEEDEFDWYENVLEIIPFLHHLQPPVARKIWINKFSEEYNESEIIHSSFFDFQSSDFQTFFSKTPQNELGAVYEKLCIAINNWRDAYNSNCELYVDENNGDYIKISRVGKISEIYELHGIKARIYNFFMRPMTMEDAVKELDCSAELIKTELENFIADKITLTLDGKYLSLATRNTKYKYTKDAEQVLYLNKKIYN